MLMVKPQTRLSMRWRRLCSLCSSSAQTKIASRRFQYNGLFLDAAGTLIHLEKPAGHVYAEFAAKQGISVSSEGASLRFKEAFRSWKSPGLKYVGDARDFWAHVVETATGSKSKELFESLYLHYGRGAAWEVYPGTIESLRSLRNGGVKVVVVSNFDTRLRGVLEDLNLTEEVDHVVVSAEVGFEKPDPRIFRKALDLMRLEPSEVVHVGNEEKSDVEGARSAGLNAWLFGDDVASCQEIAAKMELRTDKDLQRP